MNIEETGISTCTKHLFTLQNSFQKCTSILNVSKHYLEKLYDQLSSCLSRAVCCIKNSQWTSEGVSAMQNKTLWFVQCAFCAMSCLLPHLPLQRTVFSVGGNTHLCAICMNRQVCTISGPDSLDAKVYIKKKQLLQNHCSDVGYIFCCILFW